MTAGSLGEADLSRLLSTLKADARPETFVFLTIPHAEPPPSSLFLQMQFREAEGLTVITTVESAVEHGFEGRMPSTMITCQVHSALEAVGFMAKISQVLAQHEIACNVVAGFYHDHLFVPTTKAQKALEVLNDLASQSCIQE